MSSLQQNLMDQVDGEEERAGGWLAAALRRVTTEAVCKAASHLVMSLCVITSFLAVYLLVAGDAASWSVCKLTSGMGGVHAVGIILPFCVFLPNVFISYAQSDGQVQWSTLLMLQVWSGIVLGGWLSICACGAPAMFVINVAGILMGLDFFIWLVVRFEVFGYIRTLFIQPGA